MTIELCDVGLPSFMEPRNWVSIGSQRILDAQLERLVIREPRTAQIRCHKNRFISFGIGGDWMYVTFYPEGTDKDSLLYVPEKGQANGPQSFLFQGLAAVFPAKYLVPFEHGRKLLSQLVFEEEIPINFTNTREQRIRDEDLIREAKKTLGV